MKDLDQKYRNDNLSIEELSELQHCFGRENIDKIVILTCDKTKTTIWFQS